MSLDFLYTGVSWVLLRWHDLFTFIGLSEGSGLNWSLSIIFLVITARVLLFRFFLKQVQYQRKMQALQPQMQEIRKKFKDDRQAQQRAMMELQQKEGFNPLAGCLPMLLQIPIFIALFHVLRHLSNSVSLCRNLDFDNAKLALYTFTSQQTCSAADAKLFGGAPLAGSLRDSSSTIHTLGGDVTTMRIATILLVLISAAATFYTQRLVKAGNPTQPEGTAATVQKLMQVGIPIGVLFSGTFFPLGVLLYWFTSNLWTMGQQLYINKFHPHTPKEEAVPTGAVGKTLAPKPGQKPTYKRPGTVTPQGDAANGGSSATGSPGSPRQVTPRPGQRPNRPAAGRPGNKRPRQTKKRR